jgi:hypothetical protein
MTAQDVADQDGQPVTPDDGEAPPSDETEFWFLHDIFDPDELTPAKHAAIQELLMPMYRRLVLQESDELLRVAGNNLVFISFVEVLHQPEVVAALRDVLRDPIGKRKDFEVVLSRAMKLADCRCRSTRLHLELRKAKVLHWTRPADELGIMYEHGVGV